MGKVTRKEGGRAPLLPTGWPSGSLFPGAVLSVTTTNYGLRGLTLGGLDQEAEKHWVDFQKKTARLEIPHLRASGLAWPFLECLGQRWPDGTGEVGVMIGGGVEGGGRVRG